MDMTVSLNVWTNVKRYFATELPQYKVQDVMRMSRHPEDHYLYMVIAKHDNGTWAVWTCWNETTQSLNFGHYDIEDYNRAMGICERFIAKKKGE